MSDNVLNETVTQGQSLTEAVKEGASDAAAAATNVMPAIGEAIAKTVYGACYYVSFGVTFAALSVAKLIPSGSAAAKGLHDGAEAAKEAASRPLEAVAATGEAQSVPA